METLFGIIAGIWLSLGSLFGIQPTFGASTFITQQGGTGTSSPSGILYGDNGSTNHLNTTIIGSGLTFTGGILSATASSGTVSTSSSETATYIPVWTSTGATPAALSGGSSNLVWNNTTNTLQLTNGTTTATSSVVGYGLPLIVEGGATYFARAAVRSDDPNVGAATIYERNATSCPLFGCGIWNYRSRGDRNTKTVVQADDWISSWYNAGFDGTDYEPSSMIRSEVDGTPGNNDMPGRLTFWTTLDGTNTLVENFRINNDGTVRFNDYTSNGFLKTTGSNGTVTVDTNTYSTSGYPFTPTTNFGATAQATTGIPWFQNGLQASSTSYFTLASSTAINTIFASTTYASTTVLSVTGTGTTTIGGSVVLTSGSGHIVAHGAQGDGSDGFHIDSNSTSGTQVCNFGAAGTANVSCYGGFNIDGTTRLATSLTGLLKATSGTVSTATAGTDYITPSGLATAFPFTPVINFGVNTNSTTTPLWLKGAVGGIYSFMASNTVAFDQITVGSSTVSTQATSSIFGHLTVAGNASSTALIISGISACSGSSALTTDAAGRVACGAISGGAAFSFTPTTSFGTAANSTSTLMLFTAGISASSTVRFGNAGVNSQFQFNGATGFLGLGTSTPFGQLSINPTASNGTAPSFVVGSTTGTVFKIDSGGQLISIDKGNGYMGVLSPMKYLTIGAATTTTWTATTSLGYVSSVTAPFAGTLRNVICSASTTGAFLGITPYINQTVTAPSYFVASTTEGLVTFTSANTFSRGDVISFLAGTSTTATTAISVSCTFGMTETPY